MTAFDDAMSRLSAGYYNANPKTPGNPGGLGGYGHVTNLFALERDIFTVVDWLKPAALQILGVAQYAAAAAAAAEDAQTSFNATVARATFFKSLAPAEVRAFLNNDKFLGSLSLIEAAASELLPFAATMTLSRLDGWNRHLTMTGHATLADPANFMPGQSGRIRVQMGGAGGYTLSFGPAWRLPPDMDDLSGSPGSIDTIPYFVHAADDIEACVVRGWA